MKGGVAEYNTPSFIESADIQIAVYRSVAMMNVGTLTERPRREMLRICIGLRRIRNIYVPGDQ